jgi:hypothetical protein
MDIMQAKAHNKDTPSNKTSMPVRILMNRKFMFFLALFFGGWGGGIN